MKIRVGTPADAEAISKLASEFHAYLHELGDAMQFYFNAATYLRDGFGDNPAFTALVAESDDNEVVGYLILSFGYDTDRSRRLAYVDDLFVRASSRGRGIGKELMIYAAEIARAQGVETLWWGVHERNDDAMRFYERLGARYIKGIRFMSIDVEAISNQDG